MSCWAYCKPESEFYSIFGSDPVPIKSIVPIIPREEGCPLCYLVLVDRLRVDQAEALAQAVFQQWFSECQSIEQARQYILEGLPLKTSHFNGCSSDEYHMMKWGAALNAAMHLHQIETQA